MAWTPARWIPPLFAAFNTRFPGRDRATDGTIGDPAHASGTSGHNPDDTPGVKAERQDADSKPEVRAADVDADLRDPGGVTMQDVVDAILRTPRDRGRLIYIIFNGFIWRASAGWRRETYSGADKHRTHAHLSGHPDADEDAAPWTSILTLGGAGMAEDYSSMSNPDWRTDPVRGADTWAEVRGERSGWAQPSTNPNALGQRLTRIEAAQGKVLDGLAAVHAAVAELRELVAGAGGVGQAVVVGALQSPEGQAALVAAAETAEDS